MIIVSFWCAGIEIPDIMMPGGDGLQNIGLQSLSGPSSDNIAAAVGVEAATLTGSIGLPTVPMVGQD